MVINHFCVHRAVSYCTKPLYKSHHTARRICCLASFVPIVPLSSSCLFNYFVLIVYNLAHSFAFFFFLNFKKLYPLAMFMVVRSVSTRLLTLIHFCNIARAISIAWPTNNSSLHLTKNSKNSEMNSYGKSVRFYFLRLKLKLK